MPTATEKKAQIGMDDRWCRDDELEELLEKRQALKEHLKEYRKLDKETKQKIGQVSVEMPYRCGRLIISERMTQARDVKFHAEGGFRISIKTVEEK